MKLKVGDYLIAIPHKTCTTLAPFEMRVKSVTKRQALSDHLNRLNIDVGVDGSVKPVGVDHVLSSYTLYLATQELWGRLFTFRKRVSAVAAVHRAVNMLLNHKGLLVDSDVSTDELYEFLKVLNKCLEKKNE